MAARDVEGDGADAVTDKLVEEVDTLIAGIAEGEIETVADVLVHIFVIDDEESVVGEHLLHNLGLLAILLDVLHKVERAVVGALQHGGHGILYRVGGAGAEAVERAEDKRAAQLGLAVETCQVRALHIEQLRAAHHHGDTLTGIRETLRAGNHNHIAVGVLSHCGLERRLAGHAVILAEVHEEVSGILHHHHTVLIGHLADNLQFVFRKAEPGGIVGAAIDKAGYVAVLQLLLQFVAQLVAAVLIHVESLHGDTQHTALLLLHRETGVDKQHLGLLGIVARQRQEAGEPRLHRTHRRHAALRRHVDIEEILHKAGSLLLKVGRAVDLGIDRSHATAQCLNLGIHTHLRGRQAGDAHLHLHKTDTRLLLHILDHLAHLADRSLARVGNLVLLGNPVDCLFLYRYLSHNINV